MCTPVFNIHALRYCIPHTGIMLGTVRELEQKFSLIVCYQVHVHCAVLYGMSRMCCLSKAFKRSTIAFVLGVQICLMCYGMIYVY